MSVEILLAAAQLYEKLHFEGLHYMYDLEDHSAQGHQNCHYSMFHISLSVVITFPINYHFYHVHDCQCPSKVALQALP